MARLLPFLLLGLLVYLLYRAARNAGVLGGATGGSRRGKFKCADCRNCKEMFDDGVICMFGAKETFKNETHIANCHDYKRGKAG